MTIYARTANIHVGRDPFYHLKVGSIFLVVDKTDGEITLQELKEHKVEQIAEGSIRLKSGHVVDYDMRQLRAPDGSSVQITNREWEFLTLLCVAKGAVVPYTAIARVFVGDTVVDAHTLQMIRVYVSRVRTRLGDPSVLRTVTKHGVAIEVDA